MSGAQPDRGSPGEALCAALFAAALVGLGEACLLEWLRGERSASLDTVAFILSDGLLWLLAAAPLALVLAALPGSHRRAGGAFLMFFGAGLLLCLVGAAKRVAPSLPGRANLAVDIGLVLASALWIAHCWRRPGRRARGLAGAGAAVLLALLLGNAVVAAMARAIREREIERIPSARPGLSNVLLVTFDTVRRDRMSLHGGPAETPHLERLASDGVLLANHVAQAPLTGPSHFAIHSSTYPSLERWGWRLPSRAPAGFAAEVLREAGYRTGAFVSAVPLRPSVSGTRFGFDTYDARFNPLDRLHLRLEESVPARILENLGWLDYVERDGAQTTAAALDWLRRTGDRPFLLWVHYFDPHEPHPAPPAGATRYLRQSGEPPWPLPPGVTSVERGGGAESYDREARAYAYAIHYVDEQLGRLIEALGSLGRLERTLVVATADHGELVGDHGGYYDHRGAWEPVVQVFCVMRFPGGRFRGSRFASQTRAVDLFPTIFDFLEIRTPSGLDGASLLPLFRGEPRSDPGAFVDAGRSWALRSPPWKYVVDSQGAEQLYRIDEVPESTNWLVREREIARQLEARLHAAMRQGPALGGAPEPTALERLRSLGYAN